jgi:hypothetical protein
MHFKKDEEIGGLNIFQFYANYSVFQFLQEPYLFLDLNFILEIQGKASTGWLD